MGMSNRRGRDWTPYGLPQILAKSISLTEDSIVDAGDGRPSGMTTEQVSVQLLSASPTLYWMNKSAVQVASGLAASVVPSHSADDILRSSDIADRGLLCFEKPLDTLRWTPRADSDAQVDLPWDAILWGRIFDPRFNQELMHFVLLSRMGTFRDLVESRKRTIPLLPAHFVSFDADERLWSPDMSFLNDATDAPTPPDEVAFLKRSTKLTTSVLLTAGQTRMVSQKRIGPDDGVVAPPRDPNGESKTTPEVVLIDLLRPPADAFKRHPKKLSRREFDHRWWVRGHFKMQPYGPKKSLRKYIYVEPHTAGPIDMPLTVRPRINVVRPDVPPQ